MEVKEAADLLDNLIGMVEDSGGRDYDTALNMGVEALTSKPTDCISRQAAKNAVRDELKRNPTMAIRTMNAIDNLPSAQPDIIRCKDCNNWDTTWQNDWAKNYHYCPLIDGTRNGDWYCADAERREE